jgi:biopolymer transport protein ExbD
MSYDSFEESEITDINMTPFVDVVLVILVIFMVTATFISQGKIPLNLPQSSSAQTQKDKDKPITISLTKDGKFYFDDALSNLGDIEARISELENKNPKIILRSDGQTPFEYVVQIIDICKKYNLTSFAIQTEQTK